MVIKYKLMANESVYTISQYIESKCDLVAKIAAIDSLILAMELKTLEAVDGAVYSSYSLDDGQMKVATNYRSIKDVAAGINALEQIKQRYVNRLNGRVMYLRGGNF